MLEFKFFEPATHEEFSLYKEEGGKDLGLSWGSVTGAII